MKVITHKRLLGLERIAYLTPMAENCKIESCTSGITSATSLPLSKSCSRSGAGHTGTYASTAVSDFDHGQAIIRHLVRERLVNLFSDPVNLVRRSLMETGGLIKLAGFLGRSWTNDTLLSHMVTFLNDKNDPGLRAAFFQQIGPLACLAGSQCVAVLRPLLEQGLLDPSECVLEACLHALTHLLYRRLLGPVYSLSFLNQCLCLTSHPTMRIRQAAVAFIALTTRQALGPLLGSGDCESLLRAPTVSHFDDAIIGLQNTWDAPLQISTDKQLQLASSATAPSFSTAVSPSHHLHNSRISHISSEDKLDEVCPPGDVPLPETAHFDANGSGDGSSSSTNWSYCIPIAIYARLTDPEVSRIVFRRNLRHCFTNDAVLLANLQPPVPRGLINFLVAFAATISPHDVAGVSNFTIFRGLIECLQDRQVQRSLTRRGEVPCYSTPSDERVSVLLARVQSLGMTELMESQLLHLAPLLTNICLANLQKLAIANKSSTVTITAISSLNNGSLSPYVLSPVIDGCHWRRTCNTDNSGPAGSDMCIGPADLPLGRASEAFAPGERPVTSTLNLITKTTSGALGGAAAHSPAQLARIRVIHLPRNEAVSLALSTFILNPSCNEEAFCNGGSELCSSGDVEMPAKIPLLGGPDGGLKRDTKLAFNALSLPSELSSLPSPADQYECLMRHRFLVGHLALPPVHSHTGIHLARGFSFFDHPIHTNSSQTNAVPSTISAASINPVPGSVAISSNKFSHISATGDGMTCSIGFNSPKQGATTRKPTENISELRLQHEKTPSALTLSSLASNLLLKGGGLQLAICSISLNNGPYMDFMNNSDPDMGGEEINGPTQPAGACLLAALTNLSTKPLSVAPISLSNRQATVALPSDLTPDTALLTVLPAAGATAVAVATTVAAVTRATCPQGTQDAELPGQLGDPSNLSSTVPMVAGLGWAQETAYCPKGQLVVHLHEHKPGMLSLAVHPSGRLLASCSSGDGLVKLWDCGHQLNQQYQSAVHLLGKTHLPACGHIASGSLFGATSILRQAGLSEGTNIFGFSPNASIGYGGASIAWSRLITSLKTDYSVPLHARQLLRQYQPHQNSTQHQPTGPRATEMASNRFLPTRAARTYAANFENCHFQGGELKGCRGLVWTECGASLATISGGAWLHLVDAGSGQRRGLFGLAVQAHGRACCLTTPTAADSLGYVYSSSEANMLAYATTGGYLIGRDLRMPPSGAHAFCLKQDRFHGLIRCLALHSVHTWLASGTSRGHLVSWDLRYQRPVTFACHPQLSPQRHDAASLLALRIVQPGLYYPTATTSSIAGSSSQGSQEPSQQPLIATSTSTTPKNVWRANWNIITEGVGPNFPPDTSRLLNSAGRQQISNLPGAASHTQVLLVAATDRDNEIAVWDLEAGLLAPASQVTTSSGILSASSYTLFSQSKPGSGWPAASQGVPIICTHSLAGRSSTATYPLRATKAILCLPPSASILQTSGSAPHGSSASDSRYAHSINASASFGLPTILSAGTDARIRCWNLSNPEQSGVIAWPCIEEAVPPNLHYILHQANSGTLIISELITSAGSIESPTAVEPPSLLSAYSSDREANAKSAGHQSFGLDNQLRLTRPNQVHLPWPAQQHSQRLHKQQYVALAIPATGHLDIREPTSGHTNIISDLSLIRAGGGQTFLVSASMDGSIKFWK